MGSAAPSVQASATRPDVITTTSRATDRTLVHATALDPSFVNRVADDVIRRIAPDGTVSTVAGSGANGTNNGPAGSARFSGPRGIAVGGDGTIYVADFGNNLLRRIVNR